MADAVEAGKVKVVGVSNYSAEQMREAHAALSKRGFHLHRIKWNIPFWTDSPS